MIWNDADGSKWSRADYLGSIVEIEAIDDKRHPLPRNLEERRARLVSAQREYLKITSEGALPDPNEVIKNLESFLRTTR